MYVCERLLYESFIYLCVSYVHGVENQRQQSKTVVVMSAGSTCLTNGRTNIPIRRTLSRNGSNSLSPTTTSPTFFNETEKWKTKFDEVERKRKELLTQTEKAKRSYEELEKKYISLHAKHEEMETELFEKNESLAKLTTVSKNLFQEYDTLKNQYDSETNAMKRALKDASQWYQENKVLRRKTMMMDLDVMDANEEPQSSSDLENLRESITQLSMELACVQSELSSAKLLEFETSEQNANLTQELEQERKKTASFQAELLELKENNEQILRVSKIMQRELEEAKENAKMVKNNANALRQEADNYKRERNVLAHQSTLLLNGLNTDDGPDTMMLLEEIEKLTRTLEDERNKHNREISFLQEKLEEQAQNSHTEILEERLKLIESELRHALERAEKAEATLAAPPPAPPAPPLPPPPPPSILLIPPSVPLRTKKLARNGVPEFAAALGVQQSDIDSKQKGAGVNDDIINEIKGGKFTLRKAKGDKKKDRETPKAVSEMLNILGNLKRAPKHRISLSTNFNDVKL